MDNGYATLAGLWFASLFLMLVFYVITKQSEKMYGKNNKTTQLFESVTAVLILFWLLCTTLTIYFSAYEFVQAVS